MASRLTMRLGAALLVVTVAVVGLAAFRLARADTPSTQINACVTTAGAPTTQGNTTLPAVQLGGSLRILPAGANCGTNEMLLSWNTQGPPGQPGPAGAPGQGIAALLNQHCPPGQSVTGFGGNGAPLCEPPLSPAGSSLIGGGTDSLQDDTQIGMFAWGNGSFLAVPNFTERYGVAPVAGTIANFAVDLQTPPGAGKQWSFQLLAAGPDHNTLAAGPACTVSGANYECLAAGTMAVQPGWVVFVLAAQGGGAPTGGEASWGATFQPN